MKQSTTFTPCVKTVLGQPSWILPNVDGHIEISLTCQGGHMAPVKFRIGDQVIEPYFVNPWHDEVLDPQLGDNGIEVLHMLRGDFFCMPFGGGVWEAENHMPHGETATQAWTHVSSAQKQGTVQHRFEMETKIRSGRVQKLIEMRAGESALYISHELEGFTGAMPLGHHAILPGGQEGSMLISTSPIRFGATTPRPATPAPGESHALPPLTFFESLASVPLQDGGRTDGSCFPARKGNTDILSLFSAVDEGPAWTCVAIPSKGYLWYSFKNPKILPATVLWMENQGRQVPPWSGRNCCIGLEETCGFFANGLPDSAQENALTKRGVATAIELSPDLPTVIKSIQGVVAIPEGFAKVKKVTSEKGLVYFEDEKGWVVETQVEADWVL